MRYHSLTFLHFVVGEVVVCAPLLVLVPWDFVMLAPDTTLPLKMRGKTITGSHLASRRGLKIAWVKALFY